MYRVWLSSEASNRIAGKNRIFIVDGIAHQLTSDGISVNEQEIPEIDSTHEETDNRQILYLFYAKDKGYKYGVIRSPDSDSFFLTLYYAHRLKPLIVLLDIGSGEHRKLLNISDIADDFGEEYCSTLLGYYIFTGEDTTSAFRGKGKVNPLKKLQKKPRFHSTFKALGNEWQLTDKIYDELEEFVCLMYGYPRHTKVNEVRSLMLKKMVSGDSDKIKKKANVDLSKLPLSKYI